MYAELTLYKVIKFYYKNNKNQEVIAAGFDVEVCPSGMKIMW